MPIISQIFMPASRMRMFSGAMQSNISIANAYVADITPPEQRARRFGSLGTIARGDRDDRQVARRLHRRDHLVEREVRRAQDAEAEH